MVARLRHVGVKRKLGGYQAISWIAASIGSDVASAVVSVEFTQTPQDLLGAVSIQHTSSPRPDDIIILEDSSSLLCRGIIISYHLPKAQRFNPKIMRLKCGSKSSPGHA